MQRHGQEQSGDGSERHVTALENALPREPVCRLPGHQKQQDPRQELSQPHQAQIERAMGQSVDLPAHGHCLHFAGDGGQHARRHVVSEIRVPKGNTSASTRRV